MVNSSVAMLNSSDAMVSSSVAMVNSSNAMVNSSVAMVNSSVAMVNSSVALVTSFTNEFCHGAEVMALLFTWLVFYLPLLPLFLCVLYVGYRQQAPPTHSDIFTYNLITMEIMGLFGTSLFLMGAQMKAVVISRFGENLFNTSVAGQLQFHSLTCMERYLAVVHPIKYLHLKKRGGVTVRNASIAFTWLFSLGVGSINMIPGMANNELWTVAITIAAVIVVSFCSVSMLLVLMRSGPGAEGVSSRRVDQSKRRVFFTIAAIAGVLLLRFFILVPANLVISLGLLNFHHACLFGMVSSWFYLPTSLVSPLMYLHKAGKLPKCYFLTVKKKVTL